MGMKAPVTGNNGEGPAREVPPAGNYLGVCNGVYMLGTQPGYQGQAPRQQVMLTFELHKRRGPVLDTQGRVFEASDIMNFTANIKSTLVDFAGALRGRSYTEAELDEVKQAGGFDVEELLGQSCRLTIAHKPKADGSVRDTIASRAPLDPDDDEKPKSETDEVYWDWSQGIECPKRISWFWARAAENPGRVDSAGFPAVNVPAGAAVANDDSSIPF